MEIQQTAVDWLYKQSKQKVLNYLDLQTALEMERIQIMDAYGQGVVDEAKEILDVTKDAKEYYEKKYWN
jgi:phosphopantetheine adenylyltransferase